MKVIDTDGILLKFNAPTTPAIFTPNDPSAPATTTSCSIVVPVGAYDDLGGNSNDADSNTIIEQVTNAELSKSIIEKCYPDMLKLLDKQKNKEDPTWIDIYAS